MPAPSETTPAEAQDRQHIDTLTQQLQEIPALAEECWATWGTQPATESLIVTHCTHGEPGSDCAECYPRTHHGVGPSAEQRAAWAAAIAAGRDAMAARAADRSQP